MKGSNRTKEDIRYQDAICELGCCVCLFVFGMFTPGTVHHISGRTRPGAHRNAICLCAAHHQVTSDTGQWTTRHGPGRSSGKAMFEAAYGSEEKLLKKTMDKLDGNF